MNWRRLITAICLLPVLGGCEIEPNLHLRKVVETKVVLQTSVTADVMWQVDWQAQWHYSWLPEIHGEIGYTPPEGMRLHLFTLGDNGKPKSHNRYNFHGTSGQMEIFEGIHHMLFHNNDSEVLIFTAEDELSPDIEATTRILPKSLKPSSPVRTAEQKAASTKTDLDEIDEPVANMPDELYTLYDSNRMVTDNPDDYEYVDGKYVLRIHGELHPSSFIYLFQIKLLNNLDRVSGSEGAVLTGVARSVNMRTGVTSTEKVGVPGPVYLNGAADPDMLGCRMICFGVPGCNPYDEASVATAPEGRNWFVLNVCFKTGKYKNIRVDVTDKIRALPTGGVISLEIDVGDFPPEETDPPIENGGGFQALIGGWGEEIGETTITY